jgi:PAS domain-containing protein
VDCGIIKVMDNKHKWLLMESQAQLEHDRFLALLNSISDSFLAVNDKGAIELCNGAALSLFDLNVLKGRNLSAILHLFDPIGAQIDLSSKLTGLATNLVSSNWRLKLHDGTAKNVYVSISPVRTYEGRTKGGYVILLHEL